jgi:hypothetical protein
MGQNLRDTPWLAIWTRPRETIRSIVATDPKSFFYLLALIYGFPTVLQLAQNGSLGETFPIWAIFTGGIAVAAVIGWIGLSILSGLLFWTGKWIGGKAPYLHVRAAMAWTSVPSIVSCAVWVILGLLFGQQLFMRQFPDTPIVGNVLLFFFFAFIAQFIAGIWGFIMGLKALGEVQGFSAWKALLNMAIPFFLVVMAFWVVGYVHNWISSPN